MSQPNTKPSTSVNLDTGIGIKIKTEPGIKIKTEPGIKIKTEPGLKIKTEPGIKVKAESGIKIKSEPTIKIKAEPGLLDSERLSSFKLPRDLTLGGTPKAKRTFAPNLNVVRNKNKNDNFATTSSHPNIREGRDRARGRGGELRGRGRGRGRGGSNLIQSQGVFSEGIADNKRRSYSSNTRDDTSNYMEKPKLNLKREIKVDKEEEERKLQEVYEKKTDYSKYEPDYNFAPIKLPYTEVGEATKTQTEIDVKPEEVKLHSNINEFLDENNSKLIFFQFPDSLPGFGKSTELIDPKLQKKGLKQSTESISEETSPGIKRCTLNDVDEGLVGKIVIYKSGRSKLYMGNTQFNIQLGVQQNFLQNVISVNADIENRKGDMINLGHIDGSLIVSPDWEYLLKN